MKKKFFTSLAVLLLLQIFSVGSFAAVTYSGNTYYQDPYYYLARIITTDEVVVVPSVIEDHTVYSIGDDEIKWCVMANNKTRELILPNTAKIIGNYAFGECDYLQDVALPSQLERIGYGAFYGTSIQQIYLPSSLRSVGAYAFASTKLTSVTVPANVTLYDADQPSAGVFYRCTSLKSAKLDGIAQLGGYAFAECSNLNTVDIEEGLLSIRNGAFYHCTSLSSIQLPDSLRTLNQKSFDGCNALREIALPSQLSLVQAPAFYGCSALTEIDVDENNPFYTSVDGVLYSADGLTLIEFPAGKTDVYIAPVGTDAIGDAAFYANQKLTVFGLPKGATSVGKEAFADCDALQYVILPSTLQEIGEDAFADCDSLQTVFFGGTPQQWANLSYHFDSGVDVCYLEEPAFVKKPADVYVPYGQATALDVTAKGTDVVYQWYRVDKDGDVALENDEEYRGANSARLVIDGTRHTCERSGKDVYYCEISNLLGSVKSNEVHVYVTHRDEDDFWSSDEFGHWHTCFCTQIYEDAAHTGVWKVVQKATSSAKGLEKKYCKICGYEMEVREIPKIKVTTADIFDDVHKSDWFFKNGSIDFVYNHGLFKGTGARTFDPNSSMTRGMFVTVLGRLHGIDTSKISADTRFGDVRSKEYYAKYINWASSVGIVNGTSPSTFSPDANVTREQICKMMVEYCNYAGIALSNKNAAISFVDSSKISGYAKGYVRSCQRAALVNGEVRGGRYYFNPQGNATRAEVATILLNFYNNYIK